MKEAKAQEDMKEVEVCTILFVFMTRLILKLFVFCVM